MLYQPYVTTSLSPVQYHHLIQQLIPSYYHHMSLQQIYPLSVAITYPVAHPSYYPYPFRIVFLVRSTIIILLVCKYHQYPLAPLYHHLSTSLTLPPFIPPTPPSSLVQVNTSQQVVEHNSTLESVEISHTLFLLFLSVTLSSPAQTKRAASPAPIAQHTLPVVQLSISPPSSYCQLCV